VDLKTAVTLLVTVILALAGYAYSLALARRKDRLDRINRQLSDLYGPLFAMSQTGGYVWRSFREQYRPHRGSYWRAGSTLVTDEEAQAFRLWMQNVFMPLNRRMVEAVTNHADLLEGNDMPQCLLVLCAHVSAYEALEKQWSNDNFDQHSPAVNFPRRDLEDYAREQFCALKTEQSRLLSRPWSPLRLPRLPGSGRQE
jgi:hypothetical protein